MRFWLLDAIRSYEPGVQLTAVKNVALTEEYLAWAVRKDNPELLREANAYVAQLKSKGQLQEMVNRWIPFSK